MVTKKKTTSKTNKKRTVKRKPIKKITTRRVKRVKHESDIKVEKMLIENFVSLQKVMVGLSIKFEDLSENIKKLLSTFELAAQSLSEKEMRSLEINPESKEIMKKLEGLADQNKVLARGLSLMHEKVPHPTEIAEPYFPAPIEPRQVPQQIIPPTPNQTPITQRIPLPRPVENQPIEKKDKFGLDLENYQKSISNQ